MEGVWGPCVMGRVGPAADVGDPGDLNLLPPSLYTWWALVPNDPFYHPSQGGSEHASRWE